MWLIAALFLPVQANACDWRTIEASKGFYQYSQECHVAVGQMKLELDVAEQRYKLFQKAMDLKEQALTLADKRAHDWMDTATDLEQRYQKLERYQGQKSWIFFGLGVLTVVAAGYAVSHAR